MGSLDWKWIGIGVLIMLALNIVAGIIVGLVLGPQLQGMTEPGDVASIQLSSGQLMMIAFLNVLGFLIGGFIVGLKSAGRTILEPGISAAIAVLIGLILSGTFTLGNLVVGGLIPFASGVAGGWLGERRQERA